MPASNVTAEKWTAQSHDGKRGRILPDAPHSKRATLAGDLDFIGMAVVLLLRAACAATKVRYLKRMWEHG